jgi:hypothetical protein
MTERKTVYLEMMPPFRASGAVRLLELKAEREGKEYKGSTIGEVRDVMEKLGEKLSLSQVKKRVEEAHDLGHLKITYDDKRRLVTAYHDTNDPVLKLYGFIEIEPQKVKLKIEI